ncbi:hypothetical protein I302_104892 [Kwoniella bestiolae CBS 10118]|uniref:NAD-dependent epimerase/dehydratase domain-containing protein n=1 Tax=Kwoniella bestiolae CBS 10118 TaxID=1296100 RepID=A0A1B9FRG6_9TREE|nr:hypothetical protein I302_09037 [Kwoniella bestiolae CBS 10118]OCF21361.1 hypothetical protein I302_09037 [Kwoniella bestiolae CBS 10118]
MRILLTGSSGIVGVYVLAYLLEQDHKVIAVDRIPLSNATRTSLSSRHPNLQDLLEEYLVDLTSIEGVKVLFQRYKNNDRDTPSPRSREIEGVIHLAAIPNPENDDPRIVHNVNTCISYNVLYTAAEHGITRMVQASSVNITGLSFTTWGRQGFGRLPIDEEEETRGEDPYSLSKQICELQATSLCHLHPDLTIASLRLHHVLDSAPDYPREQELWCWTSSASAARACLLGLTQARWKGHEAFYIVEPEIAWGGSSPEIGALALLAESEWSRPGRFGRVEYDWWNGEGRERRGFWDCTKAERMLGWRGGV